MVKRSVTFWVGRRMIDRMDWGDSLLNYRMTVRNFSNVKWHCGMNWKGNSCVIDWRVCVDDVLSLRCRSWGRSFNRCRSWSGSWCRSRYGSWSWCRSCYGSWSWCWSWSRSRSRCRGRSRSWCSNRSWCWCRSRGWGRSRCWLGFLGGWCRCRYCNRGRLRLLLFTKGIHNQLIFREDIILHLSLSVIAIFREVSITTIVVLALSVMALHMMGWVEHWIFIMIHSSIFVEIIVVRIAHRVIHIEEVRVVVHVVISVRVRGMSVMSLICCFLLLLLLLSWLWLFLLIFTILTTVLFTVFLLDRLLEFGLLLLGWNWLCRLGQLSGSLNFRGRP